MDRTKKIFFVLLTFALFLAALPREAHAQDNLIIPEKKSALGVSPAIFEQIIKPDTQETIEITVFNITNIPLPIKTSVNSFIDIPREITEYQRSLFDTSSWFTVAEPDFILQPEAEKKVTITIKAPENVEPGGHYATIYFQPLIPQDALSDDSLYVSARVGVLAFLITPGDIEENLHVSRFVTNDFQQFGPVQFSLTIENEGNIHSRPNGVIIIKNMFNHETARLNLTSGLVLPTLEREFKANYEETFLLGKYTAQFVGSYGNDQTPLNSVLITFWIIPWIPILLIGVPLAVVFGIMIRGRKRLRIAWHVLTGKIQHTHLPIVGEDHSIFVPPQLEKHITNLVHQKLEEQKSKGITEDTPTDKKK